MDNSEGESLTGAPPRRRVYDPPEADHPRLLKHLLCRQSRTVILLCPHAHRQLSGKVQGASPRLRLIYTENVSGSQGKSRPVSVTYWTQTTLERGQASSKLAGRHNNERAHQHARLLNTRFSPMYSSAAPRYPRAPRMHPSAGPQV